MSPYRPDTLATRDQRFQARLATVHHLIRSGDLDPYDGLILWPTAAVIAAEAGLTASVCVQRARRDAA